MWCVVTIDQIGSQANADLVAPLLDELAAIPTVLGFERTAGDEVQGLLRDPVALTTLLERLLRQGTWHIGIGFGDVETPLPANVRSGRGRAFVRAREAVTAAKSSPWHLRVVGPPDQREARQLETVAWLWAAVLNRRTEKGWQVAELVGTGLTYEEVGRALGVTQSAVSQRAASAGLAEGRRAAELIEDLATQLLQEEEGR